MLKKSTHHKIICPLVFVYRTFQFRWKISIEHDERKTKRNETKRKEKKKQHVDRTTWNENVNVFHAYQPVDRKDSQSSQCARASLKCSTCVFNNDYLARGKRLSTHKMERRRSRCNSVRYNDSEDEDRMTKARVQLDNWIGENEGFNRSVYGLVAVWSSNVWNRRKREGSHLNCSSCLFFSFPFPFPSWPNC